MARSIPRCCGSSSSDGSVRSGARPRTTGAPVITRSRGSASASFAPRPIAGRARRASSPGFSICHRIGRDADVISCARRPDRVAVSICANGTRSRGPRGLLRARVHDDGRWRVDEDPWRRSLRVRVFTPSRHSHSRLAARNASKSPSSGDHWNVPLSRSSTMA